MKRFSIIPLLLLFTGFALHAQKITFMPQWTAQAQFAGFYVAQEKGFYADEGLDVTIRHIEPNSSLTVLEYLDRGDADIAEEMLLNGITSRAGGKKIVNVMQLVQESALCCVTNFPISSFDDLSGKNVGRWLTAYGNIGELLKQMKHFDINWVSAYNPINLFLYNALDATLCASYNELISISLTLGGIPDDHILRFSQQGMNFPEDGLYVTEEYYKKNKDSVDKFVRASKKGWDYAREHQDEALAITKEFTDRNHIVTNSMRQRMMLEEMLRLSVNYVSGEADYAPADRDLFEAMNKVLYSLGAIERIVEYDELIVR